MGYGFSVSVFVTLTSPVSSICADDSPINTLYVSAGALQHTISFDPVTAKYFRITLKHNPPPPIPVWAEGIDVSAFGPPPTAPTSYEVAELVELPIPSR